MAAATPAIRGVNPMECGAAGDGRGDDLAAVQRAVAVAAERSLPVRITRPHYLGLKGAGDSIRLGTGAVLSFEGGSIRYDYTDSPVFWANDARDIRILNADVAFSGRMTVEKRPQLAPFYDQYLQRKRPIAGRDLMAAFAMIGVENVTFVRPRFRAVFMAPDRLIIRCITIGDHDDGSPSRNITIDGFEADGFYMGVLGWGIDGLTIRNMRTKRWGQLDTAKYAWDCPAHPIYITPMGASRNVVCTDLVDEGQEISPYYPAGSTSWKFTGVKEGLRLARLHSRRSAGLLDFHGRDFVITDLDWAGDNPAAIVANKVIRGIPYAKTAEEFTGGVMRNVRLTFPHEMNDYPVVLGGVDGANFDGCRFENWSMSLPGERQGSAVPLIVTSMSRCAWSNLEVSAPTARRDVLAMRIDNNGAGNDVDLRVRSPAQVHVSAAANNRVQVSRV